MEHNRIALWAVQLVSTFVLSLCVVHAGEGTAAFTMEREEGGVVVKAPEGKAVCRYVTKKPADTKLSANSACFFHPLTTPSGVEVTALAPDDHRHHRGVFLAWYAMEGAKKGDFWGWGQHAPTQGRVIENRSVDLVKADAEHAELRIRNDWMADGEAMVREELTAVVRRREAVHVLDLTYKLTPTVDTTLAQSAFAGFCVRCRKDGPCAFTGPEGEVKLPDPHYLKPETTWPAADWYDYAITLADGKVVGVAVVDHPGNPPTRWHNNRNVWMVNPCITAPGPLVLKKDAPLVLRYRLVVHDGPAPVAALRELAREWRQP